MIADLLPRYYEARGEDPTYKVIRSIIVDDHEVAWVEYNGTVQYDVTRQGREGESYSGRQVMCECDFAENVGWEIAEDGNSVGLLDAHRHCLPRQAALHLRHLELQHEYIEKFRKNDPWVDGSLGLGKYVPEIILDLIEKVKAGEFVEEGSGASFHGGYFYLQTLAAISGQYIGHLWDDVYQLMSEKKIGLNGAVIQPYSEPPPPQWVEVVKIEKDGWTGTAALPGHQEMALEWKFEVLNPDGKSPYEMIPGLRLMHDPIFGPDVEDVARAKERLKELIDASIEEQTTRSGAVDS